MTSNVRAAFAQIMAVPLKVGATSIGLVREILVLRMGLKMASRKSGATCLGGFSKIGCYLFRCYLFRGSKIGCYLLSGGCYLLGHL